MASGPSPAGPLSNRQKHGERHTSNQLKKKKEKKMKLKFEMMPVFLLLEGCVTSLSDELIYQMNSIDMTHQAKGEETRAFDNQILTAQSQRVLSSCTEFTKLDHIICHFPITTELFKLKDFKTRSSNKMRTTQQKYNTKIERKPSLSPKNGREIRIIIWFRLE